jgi:hypothetical protein
LLSGLSERFGFTAIEIPQKADSGHYVERPVDALRMLVRRAAGTASFHTNGSRDSLDVLRGLKGAGHAVEVKQDDFRNGLAEFADEKIRAPEIEPAPLAPEQSQLGVYVGDHLLALNRSDKAVGFGDHRWCRTIFPDRG